MQTKLKRFLIALASAILFALLGVLLFYLFVLNIDLGCRDCQGAVGALLIIFAVVIIVFFIIGFFAGLYWSRKRKIV